MKRVYDNCCGIDVHKKLIVACLIRGQEQDIEEFGATTKELLRLADWLARSSCEMVAMESTGSYWKPLYNVLESSGFGVMVVNARHIKTVPGRKTDAGDAEWIADLLQHGLLKASYIPDKAQRELRELLGYRRSLVSDKARERNRLQKMLEGANIKLSGTISDINGRSSRNILKVILSGQKVDAEKFHSNYTEAPIADQERKLANIYLQNGVLRKKSIDDLTHIAAATLNGCRYIVSWNFKHFVNPKTINAINAINLTIDLPQIGIVSPSMMLGGF